MKLEVNRVTCGYRRDAPVLRDVSLELADGNICCILGHNGVGKSTLFKTILRLIPPLSGRVLIDGDDIARWSRARLADSVAYVAQSSTTVFPYLVEEMVMLGRMNRVGPFGAPGKRDREVVDGLLAELGLDRLRDKPCTEISGGERQLVMIAQALAQEPRVLVLDEPTANLDYGNKIAVMEMIQRLSGRGLCTIFTTHDPEHALLLDARTALIIPGEQVAFGPADQVVTERNLKRAYHATIRVVEILDDWRRPVRVCLPLLNQPDGGTAS